MSECKRCRRRFDDRLRPDDEYPNLCTECVDDAKLEMAEVDAELEDQALKFDIFTSRCPEM